MRIQILRSVKPSLKTLLLSDMGRTDALIFPKCGSARRRRVKAVIGAERDKHAASQP